MCGEEKGSVLLLLMLIDVIAQVKDFVRHMKGVLSFLIQDEDHFKKYFLSWLIGMIIFVFGRPQEA